MAIVLALLCACTYGIADYSGGRASRSIASTLVAFGGQGISLILVGLALLMTQAESPTMSDLAWGSLGGLFGAFGLVAFYHALAHAAVTVIAPITAVVSAVLPVVVGICLGERPSLLAFAGIAAAILAVALVSGALGSTPVHVEWRMILLAVFAGLSFGVIFVALAQTRSDSGLWPLFAARATSVPAIGLVVATQWKRGQLSGRRVAFVVWMLVPLSGILDMLANLFYLTATRQPNGALTIVAVVASLYPVSTVLLAFAFDRERVTKWQVVGMFLAAVALGGVSFG